VAYLVQTDGPALGDADGRSQILRSGACHAHQSHQYANHAEQHFRRMISKKQKKTKGQVRPSAVLHLDQTLQSVQIEGGRFD